MAFYFAHPFSEDKKCLIVRTCIARHEPEILEHFELVVNTASMEEEMAAAA
ncbi:MAG: hypothetical protein Q8N33_11030 [Rhodocyclaceae bacterium]|nr:hypothetical protein [Rhodocyclaceae bacterium]